MPEQMFVSAENPGEAISAVKALSKASQAGQRIYHLTHQNKDAILPFIHHDNLVMNEICNALATGKEVITHADAVSVPGWSGAGYIIYDPVTGDGAYKIGGGENGGFADFLLKANLYYLYVVAFIGTSIASFLLAGVLAIIGVALVVAALAGVVANLEASLLIYELLSLFNDISDALEECPGPTASAVILAHISKFLIDFAMDDLRISGLFILLDGMLPEASEVGCGG